MTNTSNSIALKGLHDKNVDERVAAEYLDVAVATLRRWRSLGRGPRYRKLGSLVRYSAADLETWLNARPCGGERLETSTGG